jgi:predicted acylesterase/phospholipase RssA
MRDKFITDEIKLLKESIRKGKLWVPRFILPFVTPLLKPKRLMKIVTGKQTPELIEIMLKSIDILGNELSKEKLKHLKIDVIIKPEFHDVKWAEFDKTEHCIRAGEVAAIKALPKIKKAIKDFENGKR